ncbi:unnamed protein product [Meganyctiphanes norvegica]|uniref:ETS domain-containing protein n=1 Tax=Meganyctiphanes norvegica TaxID=48144 RepID=A0AAV2R4D6_MEGNR
MTWRPSKTFPYRNGKQRIVYHGDSVCRQNKLHEFTLNLGALGSYSGMTLLQSTKDDFCYMLGDAIGKIFYKELKKRRTEQGSYDSCSFGINPQANTYKHKGLKSADSSQHTSPLFDSIYDGFGSDDNSGYSSSPLSESMYDDLGSANSSGYASPKYDSMYAVLGPADSSGYTPPLSDSMSCYSDIHLDIYKTHGYTNYGESRLQSPGYFDDLEDIKSEDLIEMEPHELSMIYNNHVLNFNTDTVDLESNTIKHKEQEPSILRDNEPLVIENSNLWQKSSEKICTSSRRKEREPTNWEFLMRLLVDPASNPKLIRWNNEARGTFHLVKPDLITELWNARSNKKDVTYTNFARGLRYHYKTGALERISERQLVYGCGPKALAFLNQLRAEQSTQ